MRTQTKPCSHPSWEKRDTVLCHRIMSTKGFVVPGSRRPAGSGRRSGRPPRWFPPEPPDRGSSALPPLTETLGYMHDTSIITSNMLHLPLHMSVQVCIHMGARKVSWLGCCELAWRPDPLTLHSLA